MNAESPTTKTPESGQGVKYFGVMVVVALVFAGVLLMRGHGGPWSHRMLALIETLLQAGWAPLLYVLAGAGYGRVVSRWASKQCGLSIQIGVGLSILLSITHLIGMDGFLNTLSAWFITGIGLLLLVPQLRQSKSPVGIQRPVLLHYVIVCGIMLAFVMACNPPGVLWASEYGGFDALSYHLQLPREWIEQGRIWPSEHNVYSFLPSYIEAAYTHIALMMGAGMHANDARAAMSAQLLSALMFVLSAVCIGELARTATSKILPDSDQVLAGRIATALTLGTPWLLVVGTLAYNEIAVVLLGVSALLAAMRHDISPWKRAIICGLIVGGACSCKPTALFLLAPSVGIMLLACSSKKKWLVTTLICCVVGGVTIAPWLIRNEIATGNPVFPQMRGVFGDGHWNEAQHMIYAAAHTFEGSIVDRFAMLIIPDLEANAHVARFRGLTNGQWGLTALLGLIGLVGLFFTSKTRRAGVIALLSFALPIVAWAMLTHLQSRFLIPLAPMLIVLGALCLVRIPGFETRKALTKFVCLLAIMWSIGLAMVQNQGNPFVQFDLGPGYQMGTIEIEPMPWTGAINRIAQPGETVYLLGDATPFYVSGDVRYNTVYDDWLIAEVAAELPNDPSKWTRGLRDRGIGIVVISFSELSRYEQSGWLPESVEIDALVTWVESLGQPIEVWELSPGNPIRAAFRID